MPTPSPARPSRRPGPAPHVPPLPVRDGLNPTRLVLPHDEATVAAHPTALGWLLARFPDDGPRLREKVAAGDVVTGDGTPVTATTPYEPRGFLYLHRDPPADEPTVEALADVRVLHRDDDLLVVDKPHLVATTPRGRWVTQTLLVHLRRTLDLPDLVPAHRLDRPTAGVLVLTVRPQVRGAYQTLFQERRATKVYEAVAPLPAPDDGFPRTVRSRIVKERGVVRAQEVPGEPNAESRIELVARDDPRGLGLYRLTPRTGKTHQLRLHLASLGLPILGDPFWPVLRDDTDDVGPDGVPLQLLARSLTFDDPLTGRPRTFTSGRRLAAWPSHG
ncbi:tRNA pseudouridine32 synthase / 23S rRNA pseudouridine746 synthase [Isoptericola jiangsuensis]|uniref:RNA pseudouridylate synthase n=1 Tax=Isoptericola jiangsuensis TaxID=548579 RepID=A0A2A9EVD2_9MICO|nr:pseudouridine synthase [Isoptericola jiangsuensis]PFG42240.1 tRNA pseudouridine32 synthase / 23S rRNA pseudouridine746 synthase [Isoptericola jiangsuensis]